MSKPINKILITLNLWVSASSDHGPRLSLYFSVGSPTRFARSGPISNKKPMVLELFGLPGQAKKKNLAPGAPQGSAELPRAPQGSPSSPGLFRAHFR